LIAKLNKKVFGNLQVNKIPEKSFDIKALQWVILVKQEFNLFGATT